MYCVCDLLFCVAAFCPFHIGNFALTGLQAQELVSEGSHYAEYRFVICIYLVFAIILF